MSDSAERAPVDSVEPIDLSESDLRLILGALRHRVDAMTRESPDGMKIVIDDSNSLRLRVLDELERRGCEVMRNGIAEYKGLKAG